MHCKCESADCELYDDGVRYYYEDEKLELGNILDRIRSFFKYSGSGYKANPKEYTLESVLREYADCRLAKPETLTNEVSINNERSAASTTNEPGSTEEDANQTIAWNLSASVLYDIFGQLLTMKLPNGVTPISRENHTIKHLATIIHQNFHFTRGNSPTLDQIERQLQRMSEPGSVGAKRDKITINCQSESNS